MKRFLLLLVLASFTGVWASGADVTPEQALQQARQFMLSKMQHQGKGKQAPATAPQMTLAGRVNDLYVFNAAQSNGGYVIVSNDDCAVPVLGYSERGTLDVARMPENMRAWLQGYADQISWAKAHPKKTHRMMRAKSKVKTPIEPLVQTLWNQHEPYNNLCPDYQPGARSVTGCVATAMAQVMYFTEMRAGSTTTYTTADIPSYITLTNEIAVEGIEAGTAIDWYKMKPVYDKGETGESADAVAQLLKCCGVSVMMNYGKTSGAWTRDVAPALKAYFGYSNTVKYVSRSDYTYTEWIDMMYHELSLGRPICFSGGRLLEGHAFVCDGYQGEDFFHINWGWGGKSDAYFRLSVLDPDEVGIGASDSEEGFQLRQEAVIGIQKANENLGDILQVEKYDYKDLKMGRISIDKTHINGGESVEITVPLFNGSSKDFEGDIVLLEENNDNALGETLIYIPAGQSKDVVLKFTPEDVTHDYQISVGFYYNENYNYLDEDDIQYLNLHVTGSGAEAVETTDNVDLTIKKIYVKTLEWDDKTPIFLTKTLDATLRLKNETDNHFYGVIQIDVLDGNSSLVGMVLGRYTIYAKDSIDIPVVATGLTYGEKYRVYFTYLKGDNWMDWTYLARLECRPGIVATDGKGKTNIMLPAATYDVPKVATSVDLTSCGVATVNVNSNPNTLYILGEGDAVPAGLTSTNVVKGDDEGNYKAETITMTDSTDFRSPVDFTAEKVELVYNNTKQGNGTNGWNTLMLPFKATRVTADGEPVNWYHSSTDSNGRFWLKRFAGEEVSTVYFDYEAGDVLEANTPYLIAMPEELNGKTIKFIGENTTVHVPVDFPSTTASNYIFRGSTVTDSVADIYTLNAEGTSFVLDNKHGAFRAYFSPITFNPAVSSLSIADDEITGITDRIRMTEDESKDIYDLQGRKVTALKKGIYITRGKKVKR